MQYLMMAALFSCLISCATSLPERPQGEQAAAFKDRYSRLVKDYGQGETKVETSARLTLTADAIPLVQLLRVVSDQSGISVIAAKELDREPVSLEVKDIPCEQVLGAIARRLSQRLTKIGQIYYIGQIAPEDRGVLVRRVRRLDNAGLKAVLELFRSEYGKSESFPDGLVVVSDRVEILERVDQCLTQVETSESVSWVCQMYLVSMSDKFKRDLGIDLSQNIKFSWQLNSATGTDRATASGALDALLVAAWDSPQARVVAQPLLLIRDGSTASLISGDDQPVPKKSVSPEGTVSTTGFDHIQTGLTVKVGVRDETISKCHGKFYVELSQITGQVEYAPIVAKQVLELEVSLESGGVYLLGSLSDHRDSLNWHGSIAPTMQTVEASTSQIQVFAKVYRIGPPPMLPLNDGKLTRPGP